MWKFAVRSSSYDQSAWLTNIFYCAFQLWRNQLRDIIHQLNRKDFLTKEEIQDMHYFGWRVVLSSNPVVLARHSPHKAELFFKDTIVVSSLGKVKHYAIVNFEHISHIVLVFLLLTCNWTCNCRLGRDSPTIYSLVCVVGFPDFSDVNKYECKLFSDKNITCELPDIE